MSGGGVAANGRRLKASCRLANNVFIFIDQATAHVIPFGSFAFGRSSRGSIRRSEHKSIARQRRARKAPQFQAAAGSQDDRTESNCR